MRALAIALGLTTLLFGCEVEFHRSARMDGGVATPATLVPQAPIESCSPPCGSGQKCENGTCTDKAVSKRG